MRKGWVLITCSFIGLFGLAVMTNDRPPEAYSKAMKALNEAAQKVDKAITDEDYEVVSKNADAMLEPLKTVQTYWTGKADDAVTLTEAATKAAIDLTVSADLKSSEGVAFSVKQLTDTCTKCHTAHREKLPDGSFEIK